MSKQKMTIEDLATLLEAQIKGASEDLQGEIKKASQDLQAEIEALAVSSKNGFDEAQQRFSVIVDGLDLLRADVQDMKMMLKDALRSDAVQDREIDGLKTRISRLERGVKA